MEYLTCAVAGAFVLYLMGGGISFLLLPRDSRRSTLIIAPWVGYCYACAACWLIYYLGGTINRAAVLLVLSAPIACLAVAIFKEASVLRALFADSHALGALAISGTVFLAVSVPVFWATSGLTTVSLFNHDVAQYATVSRFLAEFGRGSVAGFVGQQGWLDRLAEQGYFGPPAIAAFESSWLGVMPHQTTTLCINLFCAFVSASVFLLLFDTLRLTFKAALCGTALMGFHPAFHYIVLQGYFGQVTGMGLAVLLFWTNNKLLEERLERGDFARYLILLICFTSGLLFSYQHMLPFVWFIVLAHSAILAFSRRNNRLFAICLSAHLLAFAASASLCPPRALSLFKVIQSTSTAEAGWFLPFFAPDYLLGLSYQNSPFVSENPQLHVALAIMVGLFGLFLFLVTYKNANDITLSLWVCCGILYSGCIVLAMKGAVDGQLGGYKSFKLATFFMPLFVASFTSLLAITPGAWGRVSRISRIVAVAGLTCAYVRFDTRLLMAVRAIDKRVEPAYQDLLLLDADSKVDSVNILGPNGWENMWAAYFLMHKKLYFESSSYYSPSALEGAFDLEYGNWDASFEGPQSTPGPAEPPGTYDIKDSRTDPSIWHLRPTHFPRIYRLNDRFTLVDRSSLN